MAKETFYFSHDYNARNDIKIKKLILKHGFCGYGIFWAIIEDLYNKGVNKTHMIFYEINAMMGNIKQAYNIHKNEWDNLTFDDLIKLIPSLSNAKSVMMGDELSKYYRKIKMRMFREGILGKKMR